MDKVYNNSGLGSDDKPIDPKPARCQWCEVRMPVDATAARRCSVADGYCQPAALAPVARGVGYAAIPACSACGGRDVHEADCSTLSPEVARVGEWTRDALGEECTGWCDKPSTWRHSDKPWRRCDDCMKRACPDAFAVAETPPATPTDDDVHIRFDALGDSIREMAQENDALRARVAELEQSLVEAMNRNVERHSDLTAAIATCERWNVAAQGAIVILERIASNWSTDARGDARNAIGALLGAFLEPALPPREP